MVDTSILSFLAPGRTAPTEEFSAWLRAHAAALYLSAVTIAEIEQGIGKLRRTGGSERASRLTAWLDEILATSADRILPVDARVGRVAGALSDQAFATGRHPGFADVAIAATAIANGLTLLTRNGRHFSTLGVSFIDPVDALPPDLS